MKAVKTNPDEKQLAHPLLTHHFGDLAPVIPIIIAYANLHQCQYCKPFFSLYHACENCKADICLEEDFYFGCENCPETQMWLCETCGEKDWCVVIQELGGYYCNECSIFCHPCCYGDNSAARLQLCFECWTVATRSAKRPKIHN